MPKFIHVQIHRFRGSVAVYVGRGETAYLSPKDAKTLAKALTRAAKSCETESFVDSTCGTFEASFISEKTRD